MQPLSERKQGRAAAARSSSAGNGSGDARGNSGEPPAAMQISATEGEVIALFVQLARILGLPRSYAEIYGLLFISPKPLALDDIIELLGVSRGSASQGLRYLRNLGAIRMVYSMGDRRIHYEAVAELKNLVTRFLRERVVPHLDSGLERIEHVKKLVKDLPPDKRSHVQARLSMLHSWEKKSRRFVGIVTKLLGV